MARLESVESKNPFLQTLTSGRPLTTTIHLPITPVLIVGLSARILPGSASPRGLPSISRTQTHGKSDGKKSLFTLCILVGVAGQVAFSEYVWRH